MGTSTSVQTKMGCEKMTAKNKKILIIVVLILGAIYMFAIQTPHYIGRTVVDLDNRTFKTVSKAYISFDGTDKIVAVPEIKPMERIVIIMPENIFGKSIKTTAYITYAGTTTILADEYYSLENDSNKGGVYFCESAIFESKLVRSGDTYTLLNFFKELPLSVIDYLKPYTRIIDMNDVWR